MTVLSKGKGIRRQRVNPRSTYGGPTPGGLPNQGVPGAGPGPRPGIENWIRNNLPERGREFGPGLYSNQWMSRGPLRGLANDLASQGLGRRGLNYLFQNQGLEQALQNGINGRPIQGITAEQIRGAMQQGIGRGGVGDENWGNSQTALFQAFPELRDQYLERMGLMMNPAGTKVVPMGQQSPPGYDSVLPPGGGVPGGLPPFGGFGTGGGQGPGGIGVTPPPTAPRLGGYPGSMQSRAPVSPYGQEPRSQPFTLGNYGGPRPRRRQRRI